MPVELPAPGRVRRRIAENAYPVKKFTELLGQSGEFGKRFIELHRIARGLIGAFTETAPHEGKGQRALSLAQLGKAKPMAHEIAMDVAPGSPHLALNVETHRRALRRIERRQER